MDETIEDTRRFENSLAADNNHTTERLPMSPNVSIVSSEQYSSGLVLMNKLYEVLKDQMSTEQKILNIETEFYFREIHEYRNVDQLSTMDLIILYGKLEELKIKTSQIKNELMRQKGMVVCISQEGTKEKSRLDCIVDFIVSIEQCLQFVSKEKKNLREKICRMRVTKLNHRNQENNDNQQDSSISVNSENLPFGRKRPHPRVLHIDTLKKKKLWTNVANLNGNTLTRDISLLPSMSLNAMKSSIVNCLPAITSIRRSRRIFSADASPSSNNTTKRIIHHFSTLQLNAEEIPTEKNTDATGTSSKMTIESKRRLVVLLPRLNINEYLRNKLIPGLVGLQNNGKWSYINSIAQCLSNTPKIAQFFIENPTLRDPQASNEISLTSHQITVEFAAVIRAIWSGSHRSVSPEALRDALAYNSKFDNTGRTDPYLILSYLLKMLHRNLKKEDNSRIIGPLLPDELQWHTGMKGQSSIISNLFYGQCRTSFTCPKCTYESVKYKIIHSMNISLRYSMGINKSVSSLDYLLKQSLRQRFNNGWSCSSCGHQGGWKKIDYTKLPPIVIIQLDRYAIFHRKRIPKIVKRVKYKDNFLRIPRLVEDPVSDCLINTTVHQTYEIYAICCNKEPLKNGNFFAVCKNPTTLKYHRFDDENVIESPMFNHERESYLFFYKAYQHD